MNVGKDVWEASPPKYSRRLTCTSETNTTPEYRSNSGASPARIVSTHVSGTTVITMTRVFTSLNIRCPS